MVGFDGFYSGYFVAGYEAILEQLAVDMKRESRDSFLVVLTLANGHARFAKEYILPYVEYWNCRSGDALNFFFLGYVGSPADEDGSSTVLMSNAYRFEERSFVDSLECLEKLSAWRYSGDASVLFCSARWPAGNHSDKPTLDLTAIVDFDLEKALKEGVIETIPWFFENVIRFAKERGPEGSVWSLSDSIGGRSAALALVEGLWEYLPKGTRKLARVMDYFRIKDRGKDA